MAGTAHDVRVRRVYEEGGTGDGTRVLVDRLWPRGLSREAARLDAWLKDAAPSRDLRRWYGHEPERYADFARRYRAELAGEPGRGALARLEAYTEAGPLTLLTATRDLALSHARVLRAVLTGDDA